MELLGVYKGAYVSAPSAATKLDVEAIFAGCSAVDSVADILLEYADNFDSQALKLDKNALAIDDETVENVALEYYNYLISAGSNIKSSTQNIREVAAAQYNKIQGQLNEEAKRQDLAAGNSR